MSNVQLQSQEIIKTDAPVFDDIDSASEALLARWEDAAKPSEQETDVATEPAEEEETEQLDQEAEDDAELIEDDADEDPEEEEEAEEPEADQEEEITLDDDTLVEIMVDGEAQQASIAQLKRLYGQEASLTRKSQDVAKQRKQAEEAIGKTNVGCSGCWKRHKSVINLTVRPRRFVASVSWIQTTLPSYARKPSKLLMM